MHEENFYNNNYIIIIIGVKLYCLPQFKLLNT